MGLKASAACSERSCGGGGHGPAAEMKQLHVGLPHLTGVEWLAFFEASLLLHEHQLPTLLILILAIVTELEVELCCMRALVNTGSPSHRAAPDLSEIELAKSEH